jgi:hypothetical protein
MILMTVQSYGLYFKTKIVTNFAFAMIINYDPRVVIYDHKAGHKLKCTLRS